LSHHPRKLIPYFLRFLKKLTRPQLLTLGGPTTGPSPQVLWWTRTGNKLGLRKKPNSGLSFRVRVFILKIKVRFDV
jgi:hypothetical protein